MFKITHPLSAPDFFRLDDVTKPSVSTDTAGLSPGFFRNWSKNNTTKAILTLQLKFEYNLEI